MGQQHGNRRALTDVITGLPARATCALRRFAFFTFPNVMGGRGARTA